MASSMPLPVPPRTPTPPPDDHDEGTDHVAGLGFDNHLSPGKRDYNPNALSPMSANFAYGNLGPSDSVSQRATPSTVFSPSSATFPYSPASGVSGMTDTEPPSLNGSDNIQNPFNFQPVTYMPGKPQTNKSVCVLSILP